LIYFDSSALVKLVITEPESTALRAFLVKLARVPHLSSALATTELRRTLMRLNLPKAANDKADEVLASLMLVPVTQPVLEYASVMPGRHLRTLDAIHLATAFRLHSALVALVTYDKRMMSAAVDAGMPVESPT
jgi:uncharacterized protein